MRIYESENVTLLCFALAHGDKSFGVLRPCARMDLRKEWADYELYICDLSCEHEMLVSWVKPLIFCMRHARQTFGQEIYMSGFRWTACRQALQVGKRKMLRRETELRLEIVPQNLAPFLRAAASALGRKFIAFANCIHPLHMQNAICCCTDVFASAKSSKEFIFCWNRPHLKMISFLWAKRGQNPKPQNWKIEQTRASIHALRSNCHKTNVYKWAKRAIADPMPIQNAIKIRESFKFQLFWSHNEMPELQRTKGELTDLRTASSTTMLLMVIIFIFIFYTLLCRWHLCCCCCALWLPRHGPNETTMRTDRNNRIRFLLFAKHKRMCDMWVCASRLFATWNRITRRANASICAA